MSSKLILAFLSLVLTSEAFALNQGFEFHRQSLLKKYHPILSQDKMMSGASLTETLYFDQKLNHKSKTSATFKQRYFIDSKYAAKSPEAPVFYIICGEWNCEGTSSYTFVESLAKKFKGHLVALEHRFYGESLPTKKLTADALKNLNLEFAIEDLASVQRFLMSTKGMKGKWIAAGGSYAGTLSAFYRLKHPELVAGSLASSAPVLMKNEFFEYDAHVAKVINKSSCGDKVREAVKLIEKKLETPAGALEVKKKFKADNLKDNRDFLYVVADMLAAAVQYGKDKVFCDSLASSSDLIDGYAKGGLTVLTSMGTTPFDISLAVAERQEVTADDNMRQWMWQSCQQFGWFQVANGTGKDSSRSSQIDLKYHQDICKRLYGVSMGTDGALNANWYSPLFDPKTSGIIFTNGSNDPWLTLSVTEESQERNNGLDLMMMEGAAHCNDLKLTTNLPSVLAAHTAIEKIVADWLK